MIVFSDVHEGILLVVLCIETYVSRAPKQSGWIEPRREAGAIT